MAGHGGWRGDAPAEEGLPDVVTADDGIVVFNKWRLLADKEAGFTKTFILLNSPAFAAAQLCMRVLSSIWGQFEAPFPFGLSYGSYTITIGFFLSLIQWFGIGTLCDTLQKRFWQNGAVAFVWGIALPGVLLSGPNLMDRYLRESRASSRNFAYNDLCSASNAYGVLEFRVSAASLDSDPGLRSVQTRLSKLVTKEVYRQGAGWENGAGLFWGAVFVQRSGAVYECGSNLGH